MLALFASRILAVVGHRGILCFIFLGLLVASYYRGRSDQLDVDTRTANDESNKFIAHIQDKAIELNKLSQKNAASRWEITQRGNEIKELTKKLITAKSDAACIIPVGYVKLYNSSYEAGTLLPAAGSGDDETASNVALSTVARIDQGNRLAFEEMREQCAGLQRERQLIATPISDLKE